MQDMIGSYQQQNNEDVWSKWTRTASSPQQHSQQETGLPHRQKVGTHMALASQQRVNEYMQLE